MTQKQKVIEQLNNSGEISRNFAIYTIKPGITRLGAIIANLKKEGWKFKGIERNGDYVYKLATTEPQDSPRNDLNPKKDTSYVQDNLFKMAHSPIKPHYEYQ